MIYIIPKTEIFVTKVEIRTLEDGRMYYLVTDEDGQIWGDWREEGQELYGNFPLEVGFGYKIEYSVSRNGKYQNIKSAWKVRSK